MFVCKRVWVGGVLGWGFGVYDPPEGGFLYHRKRLTGAASCDPHESWRAQTTWRKAKPGLQNQ